LDNVTPSAHRSIYSWLAKIAVILALIVIMLGAYTRLKDAGLGCPDWPGCYGKMLLPQTTPGLQAAQMAFPHLPLEPQKAWAEMIHRYFAGTLGVLILILTVGGIGRRLKHPEQPIFILGLMVFLVIFQAVLGMWTVTWKLLPLIVTAHLMMGMTLAGCLMWVALKSCPALKAAESSAYSAKPWIVFGLLILGIQIFLGAWTSTHYAALACPHFPTCQGKLFPPLDWASAFNLLNPIGPNYEGGKLTMMARVTIHMAHRYWAFFTSVSADPGCLTGPSAGLSREIQDCSGNIDHLLKLLQHLCSSGCIHCL